MITFFVNVILGILDGINFYLVFCKITRRKNALAKANLVFILLWGIVMGSVPTLLPSEKYVFIQKIILISGLLLSIHFFYNHKCRIYDTFIVFGLLSGWTLFLNICVIKIVENIHFVNQVTMFFTGQFLILSLILFSFLLPIDKLYEVAQKSVTTEWTLTFLSIVYLVYFGKAKFNPLELAKDANTMIFIMVISLVVYWKRLVEYEKELKMHTDYAEMTQAMMDSVMKRAHRFDNVYSSISGSLAAAESLDVLKADIDKLANMVLIDSDTKKIMTADNKYIVAFIFSKKQRALEEGKDIVTDINYQQECRLIPDHIIIVDLLGELIDNAIQNSNVGTVIQVRLQVDEHAMYLEVENMHEWIDDNEKKRMFLKGYSTSKHATSKRGYGLSNVEDAVYSHNGTIEVLNLYDADDNQVVRFKIAITS